MSTQGPNTPGSSPQQMPLLKNQRYSESVNEVNPNRGPSPTPTNQNTSPHRSYTQPAFTNRSLSMAGSVKTDVTNTPTKSVHYSRKEELQMLYQKFLRGVSHSINIIKAVMMRLIFSLHSLIAIVYVYIVKQDEWYFVNIVGVVFLLIELFITIIKRKGKEPRWFFPCFFIYICTMIPPIWFVELTRIEMANKKRRDNSTTTVSDESDNINFDFDLGGLNDTKLNDLINLKLPTNIPTDLATISVSFEISLLMLVIMGRWFLPKGNISRSTLSQLLLVYMSLASDIVDLLSLLNENQVQESSIMSYFTLTIFSWSLFQFSLNLVVTRGRSFQSVNVEDPTDNMEDYQNGEQVDTSKSFFEKLNEIASNAKNNLNVNGIKKKKPFCVPRCFRFDLLDSEIWSILITLIFQDGPFLALRLTAVIKFNVRTFVTMFFTCKNAIILFLQFYRLSAIYTEAKNNQSDVLAGNKADALASLNAAATQLDKFVLLSYAQNYFMGSKNKNSKSTPNMNPSTTEEAEKKLMSLSPIILRSTLSRNHSYAVVLTPNFNLSVECCNCDCHPKESGYI